MNKLESSYAALLEARKIAGEILWYEFEAIKLKLGNDFKTTYTADFFVMTAGFELEVHEVKGFWEDDARVKIKTASRLFPFRFIAVTHRNKAWQFEEIA